MIIETAGVHLVCLPCGVAHSLWREPCMFFSPSRTFHVPGGTELRCHFAGTGRKDQCKLGSPHPARPNAAAEPTEASPLPRALPACFKELSSLPQAPSEGKTGDLKEPMPYAREAGVGGCSGALVGRWPGPDKLTITEARREGFQAQLPNLDGKQPIRPRRFAKGFSPEWNMEGTAQYSR